MAHAKLSVINRCDNEVSPLLNRDLFYRRTVSVIFFNGVVAVIDFDGVMRTGRLGIFAANMRFVGKFTRVDRVYPRLRTR